MCLIIDSTKHKKLFGFYLPKIAWKDIPVYKLLEHPDDSTCFTPFQLHFIEFHKNRAILRSILIQHNREISKGIHALRNNIVEKSRYDKIHKAIIPRGSLYYIGMHLDIVSTKLIIFEND